ncbi:hypothetical protein ACFTXM_05305 [Streptomyces sp. NPDC056930]|uniref:hypothetical protein n=1 Tax=Streptomyces sp. NPDC056930 TaxID=3345967 RepID=UPI00363F6589
MVCAGAPAPASCTPATPPPASSCGVCRRRAWPTTPRKPADGLVFVGDSHGGVYTVDGDDGRLLWHPPNRHDASSPAICGSSGWLVSSLTGAACSRSA